MRIRGRYEQPWRTLAGLSMLWLCLGAASGCNHRQPVTITVPVHIPVPVPCPEPPPLEFPELDLLKLTPDSTPDQVAKAAVLDLHRLRTALQQALAALQAYRKDPARP